jgi:hypothetical protein
MVEPFAHCVRTAQESLTSASPKWEQSGKLMEYVPGTPMHASKAVSVVCTAVFVSRTCPAATS